MVKIWKRDQDNRNNLLLNFMRNSLSSLPMGERGQWMRDIALYHHNCRTFLFFFFFSMLSSFRCRWCGIKYVCCWKLDAFFSCKHIFCCCLAAIADNGDENWINYDNLRSEIFCVELNQCSHTLAEEKGVWIASFQLLHTDNERIYKSISTHCSKFSINSKLN